MAKVSIFKRPRGREMTNREALVWLWQKTPFEAASMAEVARELRWPADRTYKAVKGWETSGKVQVDRVANSTKITILVSDLVAEIAREIFEAGEAKKKKKRPGKSAPADLEIAASSTRKSSRSRPGNQAVSDLEISPKVPPCADLEDFSGIESRTMAYGTFTAKKSAAFPDANADAVASKIPPSEPLDRVLLDAVSEALTTAPSGAEIPPPPPAPNHHPDTVLENLPMGLFSRAQAAAPDTKPAEPKVTAKYNFDSLFTAPTVPNLPADGRVFAKPAPKTGGAGGIVSEADDDDVMPLDAMGWALVFGAGVLISFGAALAIVSAHVLYPGVPISWFPEFAACMVAAMEVVRLLLIAAVTRWRKQAPWWAIAAAWIIIMFGESVSLIAVNAELHAMHQGDHPAATAAATQGVTEANAQIDYWKGVLADIDKRIELADSNTGKIVSADAKRATAKSVQDAKRASADPRRAQLSKERDQAARSLAAAQGEAAKATGKASVVDSEAGVIRRTAALLHVSGETAATYYIAATTMLVGPFAGVMVMFANSRRRRKPRA